MILYTIVDINDIFYNQNPAPQSTCCKDIGNLHIEGTRCENGIKIQRIISTNPSDYLDEKYRIGNYIN